MTLGSKSHFFAYPGRRGCCGLLVGDRRPAFKGDLIVLRLAVRLALKVKAMVHILIAALKDLAVQKGKGIWIDCPEDLLLF